MKIKFKNLLLTMAVLLCSITSNADNAFTSSTSMGDFVFEGKCVEYLHDAGSWTLGYGCSWQSTNNNNIYTYSWNTYTSLHLEWDLEASSPNFYVVLYPIYHIMLCDM